MNRKQETGKRMEKTIIMCCFIFLLCALTACSDISKEDNKEGLAGIDPVEKYGESEKGELGNNEFGKDEPGNGESNQGKEKIVFLSEEDVKNMSDECLINLSQNAIDSNNSVEDALLIDDFGVPLMKECNETYRVVANAIERKAEESGETVKEIACSYMQDLLDNWKVERQEMMSLGEVVDTEMLYCGENEYYIVYSLRYTDETSYLDNNEVTTQRTTKAYRFVFMKQIESVQEASYAILHGGLGLEYVKNNLDLMLQVTTDPAVIYRTIREEEERYVYALYATSCTRTDYGSFDTADLLYGEYTIAKDTGYIKLTKSEKIRSADISGTDENSNVFDEGEYLQ